LIFQEEDRKRLQAALAGRFGGSDAPGLAKLLSRCMQGEFLRYEEIDPDCPDRDDHILTLFEERVLLPVQRGSGSSWGEKSLRLEPDEPYCIPRVARSMVAFGARAGRFDTKRALFDTFSQSGSEQAASLARLISGSLGHARSRRMEAGLLAPLARSMGLDLDLHDAVDQYVIHGILSPCKGVSQASGLAWYEINGCLYWERGAKR